MAEIEKQINDHILRLIGSASIQSALKGGHDYRITVDSQCVSVEAKDNQDGTLNIIYKCQLFGNVGVIENGETAILGKSKKGSPSQMLRLCIRREWQQNTATQDEQEYYENRIKGFI